MAWINEIALPNPLSWKLYFSPIVTESGDSVVYIMDGGATDPTYFYRYNLTTQSYTSLSIPNYSQVNCTTQLSLSPDGLKIATFTDRDGSLSNNAATRIEIYTIATDTWVASNQFVINGLRARPNTGVWADNDILWVWVAEHISGSGRIKCCRYVVSTNTWAAWGNELIGQAVNNPFGSAINAAGTIIYGGHIGAIGAWKKYTIATDTYTAGSTLAGRTFISVNDQNKLWYRNDSDKRQGYIDTADDSENDDQFVENTDRTDSGNFGVRADASQIITYALAATPWIMSAEEVAPTVTFIPKVQII